ncbi:fatty acid cis/trans isomerase [Pseudorhodoferax sp.]|uniref:fatty acid cis/trans isomerase n=1 Tax=Pseudorhodoferax sp. TaxID=1993553 RepID=UPI001B408281|nr:fatty acid cis/trans isomerase [Pseudorhodoferax sp.]MBP8145445.1 fatty acid cis/trans isomerase [Inhella sp.]
MTGAFRIDKRLPEALHSGRSDPSMQHGLVGDPPKTAWVIGYPLLERIYYLLVAGFDVYGNTSHQLQTRLAMDFLRMEGEANFLMLLPQAQREPLRDAWYRGASDEVKRRVIGGVYQFDQESGIAYPDGVPAPLHLFGLLQQRLAPVLVRRHALEPHQEPDAQALHALRALARVKGEALQWLPEVVLLRVDPSAGSAAAPRHYTLLRNAAHLNVSSPFRESARLVPAEHTLTVAAGFVGAYPNAIWHGTAAELPQLVQQLASLRSEADYRRLADRFAIRRTHPRFWDASDALMEAYRRWSPDEAGLLDWSRLENR